MKLAWLFRGKVLVSSLIMLLAVIAVACGSSATHGSGNYGFLARPVPGNVTEAGGNTITPITFALSLTGTLAGSSVLQATFIKYPDGSQTLQGIDSFTGTVGGVPGTLFWRTTGKVEPGVNGLIHGQFVILGGTEGLANLQGQGTFQRTPPDPQGSYELSYHFDK